VDELDESLFPNRTSRHWRVDQIRHSWKRGGRRAEYFLQAREVRWTV